jgi:glyoxylase-like metal-dependent hydrolase (beta-lactamase superfamily II)
MAATAAEPQPAKLPLPGGAKGATVELHPLTCARMHCAPAFFDRPEGRLAARKVLVSRTPEDQRVEIPVVAFLVRHPSAGDVLVDTGFHPSVAVDSKGALGRWGGLLFKDIRMDTEDSVPAQLRGLGVDPSTLGTVVMTHLHFDHAGAVSEFPGATFVLDAREWAAAADGSERDGYIRRQFDHGFDWRLLDFEGPTADSFATFGRAVDLFGDGSVRVVSTPGHSAGHVSVVLRLRDREALLCGDAAYTLDTIENDTVPYVVEDEHRYRRSLREIQLYLEQTPDALVVPGHELAAMRRLPTAL